jgi:hypothetical protein
MVETLIKAVTGISAILGGWLTVQMVWRSITGASADKDALDGRLGCQSCDCRSQCERTELGPHAESLEENEQNKLVRT